MDEASISRYGLWSIVRRVVLAPWPWAVLWFIVLLLLGALAPLLQVWATTSLINQLTAQFALPQMPSSWVALLTPYLPSMAGLLAAWIIFTAVTNNIFQPYLATLHTEQIVAVWTKRLLAHASALRLEYLEQPATHDLLKQAQTALNADVLAAQHTQFQRMLARGAACVSILGIFGQVHWSLAGLLGVGGWLVTWWRIRRNREIIKIRRQQTPTTRRQAYWAELLTERHAAAEVRVLRLGPSLLGRWRELSDQQLTEFSRLRRHNVRQELPLIVVHTAFYSLLGFYLLWASRNGSVSIGLLVALLIALQQYLDLMQNFTRFDRVHQVVSELGYVAAFVDLPGAEIARQHSVPDLTTQAITFEAVGFAYPGTDHFVLKNINLTINPGEQVALVGVNGAGKTTLSRLFLGLYQPTEGRITIGGIDLHELDLTRWREQVAAVFQEPTRYALSVRENIGFGRITALTDDHALNLAAAKSQLSADLAHFPQGLATILGKEFEGGLDLSGGQWQKLALARAHLRDADLVVLDEPTSALDARAEHEVYQQFLSLAHGKTVLLISHRLSSARLAQRIVVLHAGSIVETGTHTELVAQTGRYAQMYRLQAALYGEENPDAALAL